MTNSFIDYIETLNTTKTSMLIEAVKAGFVLVMEGREDLAELNTYFDDLPKPKRQHMTVASQQGNGRRSTRMGAGRGTLSHNPEAPIQAAQNGND
jgi:hypothetical protein